MALLPSYKRLNSKDFPAEARPTVEPLGAVLNDGIQPLYDALNRKLTIDENFLGSIKDVEVTVNASGTPVNTTTLITGVTQPKGVVVLKVTNLTNSSIYPTGAPFISFDVVNSGIQITNVTGLPAGYRFSLRVLTLG